MNFLVPNYSCLQNPWLGGYRHQIPVLSVLCPQLNLLNPLWTKFLCTPLAIGGPTDIGTAWSPRVNLVYFVVTSADQSNVYVGVRCVCLLWLLCVVQVDASGKGRSIVQGSPTECLCDEVQQRPSTSHLQWRVEEVLMKQNKISV